MKGVFKLGTVIALKLDNNVAIEFIDSFKSDNTKNNYTVDLCDFFNVDRIEHITERMIKNVQILDIQNYIQKLVGEGKSNNTIKRRLGSLRSLYNYCLSRRIIDENIFADPLIKRIAQNNMDKDEVFTGRALERDEIVQFLSVIYKERDLIMFKTLFSTGIRRDELVNIKFTDISYNQKEDSWYLLIYGKGRKYRNIQLSKQLLNEYVEWKSEEFYKIDEYMFKMDKSNVNKLCKKYSKLSGIEISPHDCRRTFAVQLSNNGIDARKIQLILGHEHIETTELYLKCQKVLNQGIENIEIW